MFSVSVLSPFVRKLIEYQSVNKNFLHKNNVFLKYLTNIMKLEKSHKIIQY